MRVFLAPHPRWYSNIAYDNTPSALKAVLDEFDPSRSASLALGKKSHTRKFTKIASARIPAVGGLYASPWVRPNRSARSKPPQRRHSVGRTRRRGRLRAP